MAQTDARAGFRLPWSSDRQPSETLDGDSTTESQVAATTGWPGEDTAGTTENATPTENGASIENATDSETTVSATQMADPWATPAPVTAELRFRLRACRLAMEAPGTYALTIEAVDQNKNATSPDFSLVVG